MDEVGVRRRVVYPISLELFRALVADPDYDGTVSVAEFKTRAGQSLSRLLS
jgi:hypothetical protein